MKHPLVSVVIPAYNQAEFIAQAIQSVLDQTYQNFEIIVVNDSSTDNTNDVVRQFDDQRLKYLIHKKNLRLSATRNTGIEASKGEIIFFLDADDYFHPQKLQEHVDFLAIHPEIGVSYNARFELNHSSGTIREMWRPPLTVSLKDLILGFPFSPSDTVVRREWAFRVGLFSPEVGTAEDTDFPCKLALAGCQFSGINRALNYRRYHTGRGRKNLPGRLNDVERVLAAIFADPRCPDDVMVIRDTAIKHHLMVIVSLALIQSETELARSYVRELVDLDPSVLADRPCELVEFLLSECIADESVDHEALLRRVFAQLPQELMWLFTQYDWSVARGFLWKGIRAIIWGREDDGQTYLSHAINLGACIDDSLVQLATYHLMGYENEFGVNAVMKVLSNLKPLINRVVKHGGDKLESSYLVNRAFENYRASEYHKVPAMVFRAWRTTPSYLMNRGVHSIFLRSLAKVVIR